MEPPVKTNCRSGFILVTVLVITAVGLLFGAGALLMFRFQCQLRIDRQHELEKVYAVRSCLNYIRTFTETVPDDGLHFRYCTWSERDLGLNVKPVLQLFPDYGNPRHFVMEASNSTRNFQPSSNQYNAYLDYEYGAEGVEDLEEKIQCGYGDRHGLAFTDLLAENGARWWVNIGMYPTGGWLQEDYGRRYFFIPQEYVSGAATKDAMRLCIIRNVTNDLGSVGGRHGWPLSREKERALVFQINPRAGTSDGNADMSVNELWYEGGAVRSTNLITVLNCPSLCNMGLQLADDNVSLFYIGNAKTGEDKSKLSSKGYNFIGTAKMSEDTYNYFSKPVQFPGDPYTYPGVEKVDGKVKAPELRAVFEVLATADSRPLTEPSASNANVNFLTEFRVTPAYQYDIFLEYPENVTNLATVAQKIGKYKRFGVNYTMLTYDTHGTENKGFHKDERDYERDRLK